MSLETDIHEMRPALDRAIADATDAASIPRLASPLHDSWSRARLAVVAFAAVAFLAGTVGLGVRLDSGGRHGPRTSTPLDTTATTVPSSATTSTSTEASTTTVQVEALLQSVDWASVAYPIATQCGTVFTPPVTVGHVEYPVPAAGVQLAIVEVACTHGAGTPPVAVYVYDGAGSVTAPHLAGTLVAASDGWQANAFTVDGATVSLPVYGFSSASIPNCCPDVRATLVWHWTAGRYELVSSVPPHLPGPAS